MLAVRELGGFLGKEGVATGVTREEGVCVCVREREREMVVKILSHFHTDW